MSSMKSRRSCASASNCLSGKYCFIPGKKQSEWVIEKAQLQLHDYPCPKVSWVILNCLLTPIESCREGNRPEPSSQLHSDERSTLFDILFLGLALQNLLKQRIDRMTKAHFPHWVFCVNMGLAVFLLNIVLVKKRAGTEKENRESYNLCAFHVEPFELKMPFPKRVSNLFTSAYLL